MTHQSDLKEMYLRLREILVLGSVSSLLGWDQQVMMPAKGAMFRGEQLEYLSSLLHQKTTNPAFVAVVERLASDLSKLSPRDQINVRETARVVRREQKIPADFVARLSRASSDSYVAWAEAKPKSDWNAVKGHLTTLVDLAREQAGHLGYEGHPYNALLDLYEHGMTYVQVSGLLLSLGDELKKLLPQIQERQKGRGGNTESPYVAAPEAAQLALCRKVAEDVGYDFGQGRLDISPHPFSTTVGVGDFRITTRFDPEDGLQSTYTTLHEIGHSLYESGLPSEEAGYPLGESVSLGVHESQSRFWENIVGRSRSFATYLSRAISGIEGFPQMSADHVFRCVNRVQPSLVRVDADEVTYSFHLIIRMHLESQLVAGELSVTDLPSAWNELYKKYLGLDVPSYGQGVMQDVHWFSGSIGYFPTYVLGNIFGGCLLEKLKQDLPSYDSLVEQGNFKPILDWQRKNVHSQGKRYTGVQLIEKIRGKPVTIDPFVGYIKGKYLG